MYDAGEYVYKVIKSGGKGLVNKNILEDELFLAIDRVYKGDKYFGRKWNDENLKNLIDEFEKKSNENSKVAVSYTHLTLPTSDLV